MNAPAKRTDKFTIVYSLWIGALFLFLAYGNELDRIYNLWLALVPILLFPTIILVVALMVSLIGNAYARRWRRAVSVIAAPFLAYAFFAMLGALGINPQRIRFEVNKSEYERQIAEIPQTDAPRLKMFDWGSTGGAAVVNVFYNLIYDESDEIGLSPERRSAEWYSRVSPLCPGTQMCSILKSDLPGYDIEIKKMGTHFYLVTERIQ
jgi:hypothetical protein